MAKSAISRSRYGGFAIDIEGLERLGADIENLAHNGILNAIRRSLRGAGGEALAAEQRLRSPRLTGELVEGIGVHYEGAGADVLVGYKSDSRLPKGQWAESGVKPHMIQPGVRKTALTSTQGKQAIVIDGHPYANAAHPGYRGRKVAHRSIKAAEWEVLADIVDEINKETSGSLT